MFLIRTERSAVVRSIQNLSVQLTTACCVEVILTDRDIDSIGAGEGDGAHGIDVEDGI
jgi:hypothetical protein